MDDFVGRTGVEDQRLRRIVSRLTPIVRRGHRTALTVAGSVSREAEGVAERDVNGALLNVA